MGLVGSLEDLSLGDILQIVSLARKAGVLNLSWGEVKGKILFKDGQVVAAVCTAETRSLPALLAEHGHLSPDQVKDAEALINNQADASAVKKILSEQFQISPEVIENAIRERIESVVFHFFGWPEGIFSFELQDIKPELENLKPPDHAFVLEVGLSPQFLAMEGTRLQDEMRRDRMEAPVGPPAGSPIVPGFGVSAAAGEPAGQEPEPGRTKEPSPPGPAAAESSQLPEAEDDFSSVAEAVAFYESREKTAVGPPPGNPSAAAGQEEGFPPAGEQAQPEPERASREETPVPSAAPSPPPASEPAEEPRQEKSEPVPAAEQELAPGSANELVIVDDDPFLLESMVHHLALKGYKAKTFDNVPAALRHLQEQVDLRRKPAAVILDLLMPDSEGRSTLGGLELAEKVRKMNPAIPVYLMTDYENIPARKKAEELGVRFFFMKPKSSQLDEDYSSPELLNFMAVLLDALRTELSREKEEAAPRAEEGLVNLGEELRREFGDEVVPVSEEPDQFTPSRGLHMLKAMINELNDPNSSGQITLLILRFAAELMNRAVIFVVAGNRLAGLGQFGLQLDGEDPQRHVRQMRIPLDEPSIFREAVQKRLPLKKPLKDTKWNNYLVEHLGGQRPKEVFVAPIIAGGKIAAILYGDNVPEDKEIGDTESLEIFLVQAGLAMEKALLERKLKEMGNSSPSQ